MPKPTPEEIQEVAARLKPDQLLVLPFYHELENELKNPDRVRIQTEYFWKQWAPKLGPTLTVLVITLRSYCYYNKLTKEKRDWCYPEQDTLAQQIGVERKTVLRELRDNPLVPFFIRREPQYRYDPKTRKKVRTTDMYYIAMDDPIAPEDEGRLVVLAAERLLKETAVNTGASPRSQFGTQVARAVDNQLPKYQFGTHGAVPNRDSRTSTSKQDLHNVNVLNKSSNDELGRGATAGRSTPIERGEPRNLEQDLLVEDILELTRDPHSRGFYRKLVRIFSADRVRALISETRQAHLEGRITTTPARYFTDLAQRARGERS